VLLLYSGLKYGSLGMALVTQESYKEVRLETQGEVVNKGVQPKPVGKNGPDKGAHWYVVIARKWNSEKEQSFQGSLFIFYL
jgi:hypothetical protein